MPIIEGPKEKVSFELPKPHAEAARKLAKACGMSLSAYLRQALKMHLQRKGAA